MLLNQSPSTSQIERLCVDVDGYKIANFYKPPPTPLRSLDLPVFPQPCLYADNFTVVMLIGVTMITVRTVSAWLAGQLLIVLPSYTTPRTPPVFTRAAGTLGPTVALGLTVAYRIDVYLKRSLRSQHRPSLITLPRFALVVPSMPVKRWNFRKAKWSHYIALTNKFAKTLLPPDSLGVDEVYLEFFIYFILSLYLSS